MYTHVLTCLTHFEGNSATEGGMTVNHIWSENAENAEN